MDDESMDAVRKAITRRVCLELDYGGPIRVVEPHVVGRGADGTVLLRAWQVRGGRGRDDALGWHLLNLSEARGAEATTEPAFMPRIGYRRPDPDILEIWERV